MEHSAREASRGLQVAPGVYAPAAALRFSYARSGGPGGQNVNKLNTKVELWVRPAMLVGLRIAAMERLRCLAGRRLTAADEIHLSAANRRARTWPGPQWDAYLDTFRAGPVASTTTQPATAPAPTP